MDNTERAGSKLRIDETQRIIEQLQRSGDLVETHVHGDGVITIRLIRRRAHQPELAGCGRSFPSGPLISAPGGRARTRHRDLVNAK